ncbi:MAG: DNA polymerase III subunit gamma/tau [Clostridia bacterium]|nr:DNA polymerase III subunit gamma/tau [Clostridia bacterium]
MAYTALYRTWRPLTFDDVVGQSHISNTLKNEISSGRLGHAYLFCGTRGTGKTSTARILSRAMNCLSPKDGNPCNECENCRGILEGKILDITEIDAASNNGVDSIRDLREEARFEGTRLKNRIYIIDEVHMLSTSAFNALLKILEEPPQHVRFILATTESHKVPETILSRCQRFDFKRIRTQDIEAQLHKILVSDGFTAEERAIRLMAEKADGSMRDALSILDQCMSIGGSTLSYEDVAGFIGATDAEVLYNLTAAVAERNIGKAITTLSAFSEEGKSFLRLAEDFTKHLRSLMLCRYVPNPAVALDVTEDTAEELVSLAGRLSGEQLVFCLEAMVDLTAKMRHLADPRVAFEITLIKMINPVYGEGTEALAARVGQLEQAIQNGIPTVDSATEINEKPAPVLKPEPQKSKPVPKSGSGTLAEAFEKNRDAVTAYCMKNNLLQAMMALESVAGAEDRNGRLCLLFSDKDELAAARGMLMGESLAGFQTALAEKAGITADIDLDITDRRVRRVSDPLAELESF